jgi:methylase of polypeptide subunit release factors
MTTAEVGFIKRFRRRYLKPWRRMNCGGIVVYYKRHLDGGGSSFGQDFVPFLRGRGMPPQPRVFEWCAGPGFIGFSLLGHGLAGSLCLADINPEAVAAARRTIRAQRLQDRVTVYHSDNLADIPAAERWDLVVSNPPHFVDEMPGQLKEHDAGWGLHRDFFTTVGCHLNPGGVVVLQENNRGSTAESFRGAIEAAGLRIAFVDGCAPERTREDRFYFFGIVRAGDSPPSWAAP